MILVRGAAVLELAAERGAIIDSFTNNSIHKQPFFDIIKWNLSHIYTYIQNSVSSMDNAR